MAWTSFLCLLALGLTTAAPRPLNAQEAAFNPAASLGAAPRIARQSIPYRASQAAPDRTPDPVVPLLIVADAAERRRAWWLWPAAGAGAAALLGHLAGSSTDCGTCESNRPWQPAATGAVLGALAGAALELTLRSRGR